MSEPSYVNANVNINFDTISSHITKTNQLLVSAGKTTVTVDPTAAVINATSLGLSTGNGFVVGQFGANTLVATLGIQGGIIGTPALLNLLTNVVSVGTFTANAASIFSGNATFNANSSFTSNLTVTATFIANASIFSGAVAFNAASIFSGSATFNANSSFASNVVSLATFTANASIFSGVSTFNANGVFTSNFILNSYSVNSINSSSNSTSIGLASATELATTQAVKNYVANVTTTYASNVTFNANVFMTSYLSLGGFAVNSINSTSNSSTIGLASATELATTQAVKNYVANTITSLGSGTVSSVNADGGSTGMVFTGGPITTSGTLTLANTSKLAIQFGGTGSNTQQTAINTLVASVANSTFLRGNGTNVVMGGIQVGDVPTLNQSTSGSAASITGINPILNGGTGSNTQQTAINNLVASVANFTFLRGNGTNAVMSAILVGDVPTLNQSTSGSAASITGINPVLNGGTGSNTASGARSNLGAAQSGVNIDIVSFAANTVLGTGTAGVATIGINSPSQNPQTANYTLVATDLAKEIYITGTTAAQTITIPSNAGTPLPATWWCQVTNDSNQPWTIAVTTDVLIWSPGGTAGSRTLAAGGTCIISKKTSTRSWISGSGLT